MLNFMYCILIYASIDVLAISCIVNCIVNAYIYTVPTASNITLSRSKKPVIHMGAEQELRQFPNWLKNGKRK